MIVIIVLVIGLLVSAATPRSSRRGYPSASRKKPLNLTAAEQRDLVAFLEALTGEVVAAIATPPQLPD